MKKSSPQVTERVSLEIGWRSSSWSEEYYKNQSSSFLLKLLIVLCWQRDNQSLALDLGVLLKSVTDLKFVIDTFSKIPLSENRIKLMSQEVYDFLKDKESYQSLQGLRTQIESLVLSDFGEMLLEGAPGIDLFEAYQQSQIILIFLDSRRYGETAKSLGRLILQDLKAVSAKVDADLSKDERKPFSVIIDEFADLATEDFIGFLDRARSSKMSVVVAHQEICDLQRISPEFAGRLMGNTSTLYAFLQKRPESAEIISGIAGTKKAWKKTIQTERIWLFDMPSGGSSLREVEEYIVHPNQIKSLGVGKCVCVKKYPVARAYVVEVSAG